jgi:hypothetical protein
VRRKPAGARIVVNGDVMQVGVAGCTWVAVLSLGSGFRFGSGVLRASKRFWGGLTSGVSCC